MSNPYGNRRLWRIESHVSEGIVTFPDGSIVSLDKRKIDEVRAHGWWINGKTETVEFYNYAESGGCRIAYALPLADWTSTRAMEPAEDEVEKW